VSGWAEFWRALDARAKPVKPEPPPKPPREKVAYREVTELEYQRALALSGCRFPPATFAKRFARELKHQVIAREEITDRQAACLERFCWTYRRQLPDQLVPPTKPPGWQ